LADFTLGEYFRYRKFSPRFLTDYLAPMGTVIWSAPASETLDFPVENFVAFFSNHRLLQYDRPIWRTAKGAASARWRTDRGIRDQLRLGCAVASFERTLLVATLSAVGVRPQQQVSWLREQALRGGASCCRRLSTRSGRRPP
jgi:predicted NAD/FAD-binding protein